MASDPASEYYDFSDIDYDLSESETNNIILFYEENGFSGTGTLLKKDFALLNRSQPFRVYKEISCIYVDTKNKREKHSGMYLCEGHMSIYSQNIDFIKKYINYLEIIIDNRVKILEYFVKYNDKSGCWIAAYFKEEKLILTENKEKYIHILGEEMSLC